MLKAMHVGILDTWKNTDVDALFFFKHISFIHYRMFTKFIVQYFHIMKYCEWHMPLCTYHHYLIDTFSWMDKSVFCKHNHSSKVNPLTQTRQRNYFDSFHSTMESFLWKDLQTYPTDEPSLSFWETQRHFKDNKIHQFLRNIWWLKFHSLLHFLHHSTHMWVLLSEFIR